MTLEKSPQIALKEATEFKMPEQPAMQEVVVAQSKAKIVPSIADRIKIEPEPAKTRKQCSGCDNRYCKEPDARPNDGSIWIEVPI